MPAPPDEKRPGHPAAHQTRSPDSRVQRTAPDRWHQLRAAVKLPDLPAADRHVFLARLDHSTYGTAEMAAEWTRTQAKVARETGLSLRQVQYSEAHLARHGWLKVTGTTGPGKTRRYEFAVGALCDCTGRVHAPQRTQPTQLDASAVASERTQPTDATPQANGQIRGQDIDEGKVDESAVRPEPALTTHDAALQLVLDKLGGAVIYDGPPPGPEPDRNAWIRESGLLAWQREQDRRRAQRINRSRRKRTRREPA